MGKNSLYANLYAPVYVPLSQVAYAQGEPVGGFVMPHELPPNSMRFPSARSNLMNNLGAGSLLRGEFNNRLGRRV